MVSNLSKRLEALEAAKQQPVQQRGLDDFYADINDPTSPGYALLNSFYPEVAK